MTFRLLGWAVFPAILAVIVLYPLGVLFVGSLSDAPPGEAGNWTLANYIAIFSDYSVLRLAGTSLSVAAISTTLATVAGVSLAWLVARTDIRWKPVIEIVAVIPFLTPSLLLAIGWAIMANPDVGLINRLWWGLVGQQDPLIDIYTFWGMACVMACHPAGFVYLMAIGPFRNLNPDLENSARTSGASEWQIFCRIQLPLIASAVVPAVIYTCVRAFEAFEIPVVLGTPARVMVFTNEIYSRLKISTPPQYGWALSMSTIMTIVFATVLIVFLRRRVAHSVVTVTGKGYRANHIKLGEWKTVCAGLVVIFALLTTILPLATIVWSSFFPRFGVYDLKALTFNNYATVFLDPLVQRAMINTVMLIAVAGGACVASSALTAYIIKRRLPALSTPVTTLLSIPWAMPGLVLGLAMLWSYIYIPGMYGSLIGIGGAYFTVGLAVSITSMNASFDQLAPELEEAASVHGASLRQIFRRILLPLLWPGVTAAWFVLASLFSRELAMSSLLYGHGSEVLSVVLLRFWEQGRGNYAAVISVIFIGFMLILFAVERALVKRA